MLLLLVACSTPPAEETGATPEPLDLPDDPAEDGVPVGVRTEAWEDLTLEVWYPASDSVAGEPTEAVDFAAYLPEGFAEHVGAFEFPEVDGGAVRDAPLREPEAPYPVVVFSHGFGGMRVQSVDFTHHLASRGYVVVAADHAGRRLADILPCVFSPPDPGCDLSAMSGEDVAVDDVEALADWAEAAAADGWLAGAIDPEALALTGHSAGAGTTATVGADDERFVALLPMGAPAAAARDVPQLVMSGTCDSFVPDADARAAVEGTGASLVRVLGAGHLAFTDLCELDMGTLGPQLFGGRDDVNATLLDLFLQLATDGCPGATPPEETGCAAYLDLGTSDRVVRHYSTVFLEAALRGEGEGAAPGTFAEADLVVP